VSQGLTPYNLHKLIKGYDFLFVFIKYLTIRYLYIFIKYFVFIEIIIIQLNSQR
jgi:hypothetical protein